MALPARDFLLSHDAEVFVDAPKAVVALRRGEVAIDTLASVEDTKGGSGARGQLTVTNLRLLWVSHRSPRQNMSLGWDCVVPGRGLAVRSATSRTRGNLQSLCVACAFQGAKFEFIFTSLVKASPRLFATAMNVLK
jgi:Bardet-Biedl syndrome 5 protein